MLTLHVSVYFHSYLKYIAYFKRKLCVIRIIYTVNLQQKCFTSLKGTDVLKSFSCFVSPFLVLVTAFGMYFIQLYKYSP